jgi:hypothetical protein
MPNKIKICQPSVSTTNLMAVYKSFAANARFFHLKVNRLCAFTLYVEQYDGIDERNNPTTKKSDKSLKNG